MDCVRQVVGGGKYATVRTTMHGTLAEQRFVDICCGRGLRVVKASKRENRIDHLDFHVHLLNGRWVTVDVKAIKSRRRGQPPDPSVIYVELRGVTGEAGWIYGKADYIAFEQVNGFFMVPRQRLLERTEELLPSCERSVVSGVAMTIYGRRERKDEIMVLNAEHIQGISGSFFLSGPQICF